MIVILPSTPLTCKTRLPPIGTPALGGSTIIGGGVAIEEGGEPLGSGALVGTGADVASGAGVPTGAGVATGAGGFTCAATSAAHKKLHEAKSTPAPDRIKNGNAMLFWLRGLLLMQAVFCSQRLGRAR